MSLSDKQWEFLKDIASLVRFAEMSNFKLTGGELWRPDEMQLLYYYGYTIKVNNNELELVKSVQKSKTLDSQHKKRLAEDFNIFLNINDGYLLLNNIDLKEAKVYAQPLGDFWEKLNEKNVWGGNYPEKYKTTFLDVPHFERLE